MKTKFLPFIALFTLISFSLAAQTATSPPASWKQAELKQKEAQKQQEIAAAHQQILAKKQASQAKEQEDMMNSVKAQMLQDGLYKKNQKLSLELNIHDMYVNGKKQPDSVHKKYIDLINSKRHKPFGEKEEWRIQEH